MKSSTISTLLPLISFVAAVPLAKRDLVWYTVTQQVIETIDVVTTVWLPAGGAEVTSSLVTTTVATEETVTATQPSSQTSITLAATSTAPLSPSEPTATSTSSAAPEPTSSVVAAVAPPAPVPTAPTTTDSAVASTVIGSSLPGETLLGASVSDLCTPGQTCVGDITFYNVSQGIGACGEMHSNSEMVVALSEAMMGSLSSGTSRNPLCGRSLSLTDPSTKITQTAKVVDKCGGCTGQKDLDLSPALFDEFYPETKGRASNIEWYWL